MAAGLNQAWMKYGYRGVKLYAHDLAAIWLRAGGTCHYCGIEVDLMTVSFDHVEPLSKGGYHGVGNLVACCITCQRTKHTKTPEQHLEYQSTERICPVDGKRFRPRFADIQRGYGVYCSRKCSGKSAHG